MTPLQAKDMAERMLDEKTAEIALKDGAQKAELFNTLSRYAMATKISMAILSMTTSDPKVNLAVGGHIAKLPTDLTVLKGEALGLSEHEIYAVLDQASNFGDYLSSQVIRQGQKASSEEVLH